jgi:glycosyltransferase involved in cell wall biosynthesis
MRCGVSSHTWYVAEELSKNWEVHVLTSKHPAINESMDRSFELHPRIKRWRVSALPSIVREIERLEPDVVHMQNPTNIYNQRWNFMPGLLPSFGRRLWKKTRLVVMQHDLAIGHWLMQRKHAMLLKNADAVTVSNDRDYQIAESYVSSNNLFHARVASHFTPPSFSAEERQAVRSELKVPDNGVLLVYFGFVIPSRKLDNLVRAAAILKKDKVPFKLILMGGAGPGAEGYLSACKNQTRELELDDNVEWTGYAQSELIERTVGVSDLFISPITRGADFRNSSFLVAAHGGVPILTTENPRYGIDRELRASNICRFFDPEKPAELAKLIMDLWQDHEARKRMSEACLKISKKHSWQEHARVLSMAFRGDKPDG